MALFFSDATSMFYTLDAWSGRQLQTHNDLTINPILCNVTRLVQGVATKARNIAAFFSLCVRKSPDIMPLHPPNSRLVTVYSDYSGNFGPHSKDLNNNHCVPHPGHSHPPR